MKNSRLLMAVLLVMAVSPASARPELCETAARTAAQESGVPVNVLQAISLTETGRRVDGQMRPWPWAANTEGQGYWFPSRDAAADFMRETLQRGQRSIDLGCFQINVRWHGMNFPSPEAMLDPLTGARYAARYLSQLYNEFGSWEAAAGAYHSRTPGFARRYRTRFNEMLATLSDTPARNTTLPSNPRPSQRTRATIDSHLFSGSGTGASLVPVTRNSTPSPMIVLQP